MENQSSLYFCGRFSNGQPKLVLVSLDEDQSVTNRITEFMTNSGQTEPQKFIVMVNDSISVLLVTPKTSLVIDTTHIQIDHDAGYGIMSAVVDLHRLLLPESICNLNFSIGSATFTVQTKQIYDDEDTIDSLNALLLPLYQANPRSVFVEEIDVLSGVTTKMFITQQKNYTITQVANFKDTP